MSDLLLPPGARLLHIGPHKTGSTAIQQAMHDAREELEGHGVHYAGSGVRPREAGWAILGGIKAVGRPEPRRRAWEELVEEVRVAGERRVCVSNEDFARATPAQAREIVDSLGGDRVHVVSVVRRLDRYLPSHWQERVKAREVRSYDEWLRLVLSETDTGWQWRNVWHAHRVEDAVRRWTDIVGSDRMTLVVADESDHDLLPRTFEELLGLPAGLLELEAGRSNRSLGYDELEMLRALNRVFVEERFPDWAYAQLVQGGLVRSLQRRGAQRRRPPLGLPEWAAERVAELSRQQAEAVRASGVRVVGDPDGLVREAEILRGNAPDPVSSVALETVTMALVGVVEKAVARRERGEARRRRSAAKVTRTPRRRSVDELSGRELLGLGLRRAAGRLRRSARA